MTQKLLKIFFLLLIVFGLSLSFILGFFYYKFNKISQNLGRSPQYFLQTAYSASKTNYKADKLNILILGMDYRDDCLEKNQNTDTIMLASYNLKTNNLNLISFPRDLWDDTTGQKINLIYSQGLTQASPITFIKDNFSRITGQKIDRILVLTTQNIESLIDLIGGVDIYLDKSYVDKQYPNPEYISSQGKAPMYITVEYQAGWNHIDSSNIAPFVRSRKGGQTAADGGTDLGRIIRQQQLIDALLKKAKDPQYLNSLDLISKLYIFWHQKIQTDFTDYDLLSLIFTQKKSLLNTTFNKTEIPVGENKNEGLIYHPEKFKNKQWVFIPSDPTLNNIHQFINQAVTN